MILQHICVLEKLVPYPSANNKSEKQYVSLSITSLSKTTLTYTHEFIICRIQISIILVNGQKMSPLLYLGKERH